MPIISFYIMFCLLYLYNNKVLIDSVKFIIFFYVQSVNKALTMPLKVVYLLTISNKKMLV